MSSLTLTLDAKNRENKNKLRKKIENKKKIRKELSLLFAILTLFFLQGFSSGETDFYLCQFLSNFFRYSALNFPLSHPYSNFTIYFSSNILPLNSLFSSISVFSCLLTSTLNPPSNLFTNFLAFSKFFFLFHKSCSAVNPFHCTRYLFTLLIFLLFNILSTSHSSTSSTSIGFPSSFCCPPTCFLYCNIQLIFTTR